ncbi:hypothetical protein [Gracilibacillus phocaeensis]|uniref:hypothetical protein n=1 Tax=Gracilibacillus phocaeensis TaxID=2042304 RepID=UPI001031C386|nr:hypothetical protein [Gracilibacillus phocaeensis]
MNKNRINSLIPLGMVFGSMIGVLVGIFLQQPIALAFSISIGAGFGLLVGAVAFSFYSKK